MLALLRVQRLDEFLLHLDGFFEGFDSVTEGADCFTLSVDDADVLCLLLLRSCCL